MIVTLGECEGTITTTGCGIGPANAEASNGKRLSQEKTESSGERIPRL